jgi:hypothetical protein
MDWKGGSSDKVPDLKRQNPEFKTPVPPKKIKIQFHLSIAKPPLFLSYYYFRII